MEHVVEDIQSRFAAQARRVLPVPGIALVLQKLFEALDGALRFSEDGLHRSHLTARLFGAAVGRPDDRAMLQELIDSEKDAAEQAKRKNLKSAREYLNKYKTWVL